jgi:transcriptional regulator with XRE-family HTH domain
MRAETEIGPVIQGWRIRRGWTAARLARASGVSADTVGGWERGRNYPQAALLIRVAGALGRRLVWRSDGRDYAVDDPGGAVAIWRRSAGVSVRRLSRRAGWCESTLTRLQTRPDHDPRWPLVVDCAEACGIELHWVKG